MSNELYNSIARVTDGIYEGTKNKGPIEVPPPPALRFQSDYNVNLGLHRHCDWGRCVSRVDTL